MEIAEGELIDRYVRSELSATDRQQFERMLGASPRLVERVEFARILARRVTSPAPQQNHPEPIPAPVPIVQPKNKKEKRPWRNFFGPTVGLSPAMRLAPLALLLLMTAALVLVWTRLRTQSGHLAAEQQRLQQLQAQVEEQKNRSNKLEGELSQANSEKEKLIAENKQLEDQNRQNPASILPFPFLLNPTSGTRSISSGSGERNLTIPSGTHEVELQLNVEDGKYSRYNASLRNNNSKTIAQRKLKPIRHGGRKVIPFKLAAKLLPRGSYHIHVDGLVGKNVEDFRDYFFRVTDR
jgi:hypothetical protein